MSAASVTRRGQSAARRRGAMTLTLTAYSPNGTTTDTDGFEVPAFTSEGTTPGKAQGDSSRGSDTQTEYVTIGGVARPILKGGLHIPITAFVDSNDVLRITPSRQRGLAWEFVVTATNGQSFGLTAVRYMVTDVPKETNLTARRLDVVEV